MLRRKILSWPKAILRLERLFLGRLGFEPVGGVSGRLRVPFEGARYNT